MSAGFSIAGSLVGGNTPIKRTFQIGETMYQGQLCQSGKTGGTGGHVQIADVASEANENDLPLMGVVLAVRDKSRAYSSTYFGDGSTYTVTQATILANMDGAVDGCAQVDVGLIIPEVTLIRGPVYNAAYGTALTVQTVTTASSGGTTITASGNAITDMADDFVTAYCRSGANKGLYRVVTTTTSTTASTVTVPFPNGIAVGDTFVLASCVLGLGGLDIPATANCIDGNNDMDAYYDVYYHTVNLEEAGKEYAEFTVCSKATSLAA